MSKEYRGKTLPELKELLASDQSLDLWKSYYQCKYKHVFGHTGNNGKTFYFAEQTITEPATNPDFVSLTTAAYSKAVMKIQSQIIGDYIKLDSKKKIEYMKKKGSLPNILKDSDNDVQADTSSQSISDRIQAKLLKLTEAKLDKALAEQGVQVDGLSREQKVDTLRDCYAEAVAKSSQGFQDSHSLITVATQLFPIGKKNYKIAVIAVVSPTTRAIAHSLGGFMKSDIPHKKGKDPEDFIPQNDDELVNEYGVRLAYDTHAQPVLISYGIEGFAVAGKDEDDISDEIELAQGQAENSADAALGEFIKGTTNYSQVTNKKSCRVNQAVAKTDTQGKKTYSKVKTPAQVMQDLNREIETRVNNFKLKGVQTIKTWKYLDKERGIQYIGVVRSLSFANILQAERRANPAAARSIKSSSKPVKKIFTRSSDTNEVDDF